MRIVCRNQSCLFWEKDSCTKLAIVEVDVFGRCETQIYKGDNIEEETNE